MIKGKEILKGIDLQVNREGAYYGDERYGKSTLAAVIGGKESYEVTAGSITYKGKTCSICLLKIGQEKVLLDFNIL